jgi:NarL family two-component system response regulator LiaR
MDKANCIRVLVVDDYAVVRGGLRYLLATAADIVVVGEADNGDSALRLCEHLHPDVVLMDLLMPNLSGIETTRLLRMRQPNVQVVALTSFADEELVQHALQAGAISYLLKDTGAKELGAAIRAAHAGRSMFSQEVTHQLIRAVTGPPKPGHDLSEREIEVLQLLVLGLSNAEVATRLTISRNTVRHHMRNIFGKLNVTNRTEAAALAIQQGLVRKRPLSHYH